MVLIQKIWNKIKDNKIISFVLAVSLLWLLWTLAQKFFFPKQSAQAAGEKAAADAGASKDSAAQIADAARALSIALGTHKDLTWLETQTEDDETAFNILKALTASEFTQVSEVYRKTFTDNRDLKADVTRFLDSDYYDELGHLFPSSSVAAATLKPETTASILKPLSLSLPMANPAAAKPLISVSVAADTTRPKDPPPFVRALPVAAPNNSSNTLNQITKELIADSKQKIVGKSEVSPLVKPSNSAPKPLIVPPPLIVDKPAPRNEPPVKAVVLPKPPTVPAKPTPTPITVKPTVTKPVTVTLPPKPSVRPATTPPKPLIVTKPAPAPKVNTPVLLRPGPPPSLANVPPRNSR